jgi:hypothetical protein
MVYQAAPADQLVHWKVHVDWPSHHTDINVLQVEFPGFRLDREFEHGFSGEPVPYDGRLVGIFSGPDYVASLWPLALMTYLDLDEEEHAFEQLFDNGTIQAQDWMEVKGRVVRKSCENALVASSVESRCLRQHVVLAT